MEKRGWRCESSQRSKTIALVRGPPANPIEVACTNIQFLCVNITSNVLYHRADHIIERITFPHPTSPRLQHAFSQPFIMEIHTQEARIILAMEAIQSSKKKLSKCSAAKIYKVSYATLSYRMAGRTYCLEIKPKISKTIQVRRGSNYSIYTRPTF